MKLKKKTLIYLWAKFGPISRQTDSDVTVRGSATMDRLAAAVSQCVTREDIKPQITPVVCASSIKPQAAGCWSVKALQMLLKLEKRGINNRTFTSSMYRKGSPRFFTRHHRSRTTINIWVVSTQPLLHVRPFLHPVRRRRRSVYTGTHSSLTTGMTENQNTKKVLHISQSYNRRVRVSSTDVCVVVAPPLATRCSH